MSATAEHLPNYEDGSLVITITSLGSIWYWVLTGIFTISGIYFLIQYLTTEKRQVQQYHCLSALTCYILSMGYFAMAAGLGWVPVEVEFQHQSTSSGHQFTMRQVYWIRYVAWAIATPIELAQLFLLVSAPIGIILLNTFMMFVVMATGLGGALIPTAYKWAYYGYGAVACTAIAFLIAHTGYRLVNPSVPGGKRKYSYCSRIMLSIWFLYGVVWGLCEGGNVLSPDVEAILYGVLDLAGGPAYCCIVVSVASQFQYNDFGGRERTSDDHGRD